MYEIKEQYIVNTKGKKKAVLISFSDYKKILDDLEELEEIRAFDVIKSKNEELIPFDIAIKEVGL